MTSDKYKNYYETLGLNSGASKEEINKTFRELSHLYHPDNVVGKPQNIQEIAAKKFNEISQARKILIDYIEEEIQDDQSFRQHHDYEDGDEYAEDDDETEYSEEEVEEGDDEEDNDEHDKEDGYTGYPKNYGEGIFGAGGYFFIIFFSVVLLFLIFLSND